MRPLLIIVVAAVLAVPRAEASYQGALMQKVTYTSPTTAETAMPWASPCSSSASAARLSARRCSRLRRARHGNSTFKSSIVRVAFVLDAPPATPNAQVGFTLTQGIITIYNTTTIASDTRLTWDVGP